MPVEATIRRARRKASQGKSPSTQAGEFIREEIHHVRDGEHGARSAKQVIAIGLSKARRAGVKLRPRPRVKATTSTNQPPTMRNSTPRKSAARARAALSALKDESHSSASHLALSRQAHKSARKRGPKRRREAAQKALRTKRRAEKP